MKIIESIWGYTSTQKEVTNFHLENEFLSVDILNYGGIIRKLEVKKENKFKNIVLSLPTIKDYEDRSPYFGAIIGRNAGRISNAQFTLNNSTFNLNKNEGNNNIHGGFDNFSKKIWSGKTFKNNNSIGVELFLESPHLEEGFPGNIQVKVRYTLQDNNLTFEIFANTDMDTYINMTNHTYFNLSGNYKYDVSSSFLQLDSDYFIAVDTNTLPIEITTVDNTIFDFRKKSQLINVFNSNFQQAKIVNDGIDHPFVLNTNSQYPIILEDFESNTRLKISTNQDAVVIYTGNYLHEVGTLDNDIVCDKHFGICFETQNYADTLNFLPEKAIITTKDKPYYHKTSYIVENIK